MTTCPTCGAQYPTRDQWFIEWEAKTVTAFKQIARTAVVLLPLFLMGCGASLFGPEPGLTDIQVTAPDGLAISYESGKEIGTVEGEYTKPDGTHVSFRATQVEAFAGQEILLQMQAQQLAAAGTLTELLNRLVQLYMSGGIPTGPVPPVTP